MRAIPEAVQTLLKSRCMIGANSPNHNVVITGAPNMSAPTDPTSWSTYRYFAGEADHSPNRNEGYMCDTSDGRAAISYIDSGNVYVAFASTVTAILDGSEAFDFANATLIRACGEYGNEQTSLTLIDGILHLAITKWTWPAPQTAEDWTMQVEHWTDTDGTGASFSFLNYISEDLSSGTAGARELPEIGVAMGQIVCLSDTNWVIMCPWHDYIYSNSCPCYTTDSGATWTKGVHGPASLLKVLSGVRVSLLPLSSISFVVTWTSSSNYKSFLYYTDCGATMTYTNYDSGTELFADGYILMPSGIVYCATKAYGTAVTNIYQLNEGIEVTLANIKLAVNWTKLVDNLSTLEGDSPWMFTNTASALILQTKNQYSITGAGTLLPTMPIRVKRIEIHRNRGMASGLTLTFDNKNGVFSPDKAGDWFNVLFPNIGLYIEQGYGTELIRTFTGTIDTIGMTTFPHELVLSCRDYIKQVLDQTITSGTDHSITYTGQTPEYIFNALATLAGFTSITTDVSGLTIAEKTFTIETYADAFSWLADYAGYTYYCDELGAIYFKDDTVAVGASVYTFSEGEDIVSLGYTLSGDDLYSKVVVLGDGVSAETAYISAAYYNVPDDKIMWLQAPECTTELACQAIADRAELFMRRKDRICEFVAVAVPWLQVGDCITVVETSTTISEVYCITDLSFTQSPEGGFLMQITCWHYSA